MVDFHSNIAALEAFRQALASMNLAELAVGAARDQDRALGGSTIVMGA